MDSHTSIERLSNVVTSSELKVKQLNRKASSWNSNSAYEALTWFREEGLKLFDVHCRGGNYNLEIHALPPDFLHQA